MAATVLHVESGAEKLRIFAEKLNLQFQDIRYSVPDMNGKMKEILHDVSGHILSGRLTAILGPSGAGKTSLLNVLAGFKTKGVEGSVLVNGVERDRALFRTQACYIAQDTSLLGQLTAKETLSIAASLKLTSPRAEQCQVVEDVLELLGMSGSKETAVSHLSGGEQKRLSIGVELITNPPIMLFDEPTSGLDSVSSAQIVTHLQSLAASGRAVACVIHQPSSRLCDMFDDVIILAKGSVIYCGPTNEMLSVFQEEGFLCPQYYNRADFALEVACGERGQDLSGLIKRAHWTYPNIPHDNHDEIPATEDTKMLPIANPVRSFVTPLDQVYSNTVYDQPAIGRRYPLSQLSQFVILLKRSLLCNLRNAHTTHIRIACHLAVAFLIGLMYYQIGNEASKINSNIACIFFFVMFLFYMNALPVILSYPLELSVILREHLNNWYSLPSYYFASCLAQIPMQVICPILFLSIAYFMTGQPIETTRILQVFLLMTLLVGLAQIVGLVAGALLDPQLALVAVPVVTIPMMLFSGFFLRIPDIPVYLRWVGQVSYFRHVFEGVSTSVYGHKRENLVCSDAYCHFKSPWKFLEHLEMIEENFWINVGCLLGWIIFMYIVLYISLKWKIHKSK